jgi:arginyl-tRNA synthetase
MTKNNLLLQELKEHLIKYYKKLGIKNPEISFDKPVLTEHGDLSNNAALKYCKEVGGNPLEITNGAIEFLKSKKIPEVSEIKFAPPGYLNIFLNAKFNKEVLEDILALKENYGASEILKKEKWLIEHTSPNPNKAMHLGHLRNNLVGMSIVRLLEFNGAEVICDAVDNNRGIAIAKLMWGFLVHKKKDGATPTDINFWQSNPTAWFAPSELNLTPDKFVSECYVLGADDFKNNQEVEVKVRDLVVKWENNDPAVRALWHHVLQYSYEGIERTLKRIGSRWDHVWHEHEHYQAGKDFIATGLKKKIFVKLEDGAILTNLAEYNLPDTILLKNDGTSLYITQDIALTANKKKEYGAKKLMWVIGPEQSMAMKQMFAVCEQLGIGRLADFTHVAYGYVGLKTDEGYKKMASREGTVVLIDDLLDLAKAKIMARLTTDDRQIDDPELLSEKLALAAVKFSLLKVERTQDITFDLERAIDAQGDTGVYLLYTYVRINSILQKAKLAGEVLIAPQESDVASELIKDLALFSAVVARARESYSVHHISQYLLQLCGAFNGWYNKEMILDGSDVQSHKLAVAQATSMVIKNGLALLGIDVVERM